MRANTILILGMHRSGTSCLTGILEASGVFLGDVSTANPHNKKGNRENINVMNLNTEILQYSGGDWDNPPSSITWTRAHQQERDRIIKIMKQEKTILWGFKDPRFVFTLPFWQEVITKPQLIATFRHPNSVADSLKKRNGFTHSTSIKLWTQYNKKLLTYLDASPFPIICFDVDQARYLKDLKKILQTLSLNLNNSDTLFFDHKLRSSKPNNGHIDLPKETMDIYNRLKAHYQQQITN